MTERPKTKKHFNDRVCLVCGKVYSPKCGGQKYCPDCKAKADADRKRAYDAMRRLKLKGPPQKTSEIAPGCEGCWYWRLIAGDTLYCCHYCLDNCLSRPCEPGVGCTVRKETKGET